MHAKPYLSIIIPLYNEEGNLTSLHQEIQEVISTLGKSAEIIYINDASTDGSLAELRSLSGLTIINLNRNYGQAVALDAGFKAAQGDVVISLDGDGQNDPHDIPRLLQKMEEGNFDVVAGWRKSRSDNRSIKILTRIGRVLRRFLISDAVHDTGCTLRAYKNEAIKSLDIGGEMHRYILAYLRWKGFTIGEVIVNDRPRLHGKSKYNISKAVRGFIDLIYVWFIYKYSQRPLHVFGYASLVLFFFSAVTAAITIYQRVFLDLGLNRNGWFFLSIFMFLASIILFSFGIVIDLLIRIQFATSGNEKRYYIRDVHEQ
jgi:glycosyltransferase involved in cell wall biosynthesis